jgi:hypothetical protein
MPILLYFSKMENFRVQQISRMGGATGRWSMEELTG